jgi:16S rRNA processing protein RimM
MHDPASDALRVGLRVTLVRERTGGDRSEVGTFSVVEAGPVPGKPGRHRVTLEGIDDRNAAEELKGCSVWADREALPPLSDDEFYLADAIGLAVRRERPSGPPQELGTVVGLMNNGAQDLFEVELTGRGKPLQWLLPVLPGFIVDMDDERILVEIPPGMLPDELER